MRLIPLFAVVLSACSAADLEIIGSWQDDFGSSHVITNTSWDSYDASTPVALTQYDNDGMYAVGQNHENDAFNPDLWSRFDWTWDADGDLWYCQSLFNGASEDDALDAPAADDADPTTGGCGGFAWSKLTEAAR